MVVMVVAVGSFAASEDGMIAVFGKSVER